MTLALVLLPGRSGSVTPARRAWGGAEPSGDCRMLNGFTDITILDLIWFLKFFLLFYFQKRAFDYFTQAANAGNTHAMAFLGKVSEMNE